MKQYDKNSLVGFLLMAVILIVFNMVFFLIMIQAMNHKKIKMIILKIIANQYQTMILIM